MFDVRSSMFDVPPANRHRISTIEDPSAPRVLSIASEAS
jgi:hypothetical protein